MGTPATAKQLRYLRALADRTGTTFTSPNTAREASRLIRALEQRVRSAGHERDADTQSVNQRRGALESTQPQEDESTGWGADCHWTTAGARAELGRGAGRGETRWCRCGPGWASRSAQRAAAAGCLQGPALRAGFAGP